MLLNGSMNPTKRCENATQLMLRIQNFPWVEFKLNEIVQLERCLQEIIIHDPRVNLLVSKLANKCLFAEPSKKQKHLKRDTYEQRDDNEFKKKSIKLHADIDNICSDIDKYKGILDNLLKSGEDTERKSCELKSDIGLMERNLNGCRAEFVTALELVTTSMNRVVETIKVSLPQSIVSIPNSKLFKQIESLPILYKQFLLKLCKNRFELQFDSDSSQLLHLSYLLKQQSIKQLTKHMEAVCALFIDLTIIDKLYTTDVHDIIECMRTLDTHLNFLKKPICVAPKQITVMHYDFAPIEHLKLEGEIPNVEDNLELLELLDAISEKTSILYENDVPSVKKVGD